MYSRLQHVILSRAEHVDPRCSCCVHVYIIYAAWLTWAISCSWGAWTKIDGKKSTKMNKLAHCSQPTLRFPLMTAGIIRFATSGWYYMFYHGIFTTLLFWRTMCTAVKVNDALVCPSCLSPRVWCCFASLKTWSHSDRQPSIKLTTCAL